MSWKKYFSPVPTSMNQGGSYSPFSFSKGQGLGPAASNYSSHLPDVYVGNPNRVERYGQYNTMDSDSEINAALDILAEFCTQKNKENNTPFKIEYNGAPTNSEVQILSQYLHRWAKLQEFETRMFRIIRNIFKYGDQFFLRDPETKKWFHVDPANLSKIIVNESEGKRPEQYMVKDINISFESLSATKLNTTNAYGPNGAGGMGGPSMGSGGGAPGSTPDLNTSRFSNESNETAVDAEHVIHMSLSEGMDQNYPFGNSLLESIFKVYKQKELLEDAIIIYRVQRAPERRVFYVDVGNMPSHLAMQFVERVKTEIHQRRIPSKTGGGQTVIDSSYNPLSINEDYFFPQTCLSLETPIPLLDGRTLTLDEIILEYKNGKRNWTYGLSNITHEMESAEIKWAGITRKNAKVLKITLDNGETITSTPDHRFIMRDGREVEAQHLLINDSLMPLELRDGYSGPKQKNKKYTRYRSNNEGSIKFVHATVANKQPGKDTQVHHVDFNSKNNNPTNLQVLLTADHIELHRNAGSYSINKQWSNPESRQKLLDGMKNLYANSDSCFMEKISKRNQKNALAGWSKISRESRQSVYKSLQLSRNKNSAAKTINFSINMFNKMKEAFDTGNDSISKLSVHLQNNEEFQQSFKDANTNLKRDKNKSSNLQVTDTTLNKIVGVVGYRTFGDWKKDYTGQHSKFSNKQNHKVAAIEWLTETMDTGDITVLSDSNSHWFGLAAGIYVHNSEGRGSKVETLPGGTNLGEIDDLRYFTNKLLRGLRIPSSYLPTGADDSASQFNDGRVGTAYIQELRFNNYCERLQSLVAEVFNKEFKLYLSQKGINIDVAMFDLKLQPPQNFASYRQAELDSNRISTFSSMQAVPFIANRFALERFLGLSKEEIATNEKLWREENEDEFETGEQDASSQMRDAGITGADISADMGAADGPDSDIDLDDTTGDASASPGASADTQGGNAPFGS